MLSIRYRGDAYPPFAPLPFTYTIVYSTLPVGIVTSVLLPTQNLSTTRKESKEKTIYTYRFASEQLIIGPWSTFHRTMVNFSTDLGPMNV